MIFQPLKDCNPVAAVVGVMTIFFLILTSMCITVISTEHDAYLISVGVDVGIFCVGLITGIASLIFLGINKKYIFRRGPRILLWVLVFIASNALALSLNELLWTHYQGENYAFCGSSIMFLFPVVWLYYLNFFRYDVEESVVWRANGVIGAVTALLCITWVIAETCV